MLAEGVAQRVWVRHDDDSQLVAGAAARDVDSEMRYETALTRGGPGCHAAQSTVPKVGVFETVVSSPRHFSMSPRPAPHHRVQWRSVHHHAGRCGRKWGRIRE